MARRNFSSIAEQTTVPLGCTSGATSFDAAALVGYPTVPFTAIIDENTPSEEIVEVTAVSTLTLTVTRGVDGTTAVAHGPSATFRHGVSARDFGEPNAFLNGAGAAAIALGSAAAPTIAFTGDTNTGIYSPGADQVGIATAGTEKVRINSVGLITGSGTSLGAWTAYTPTLAGTGWSLGNGTIDGGYVQIGKLVTFWARFASGSTSTYGSADMTVTVPVAKNAAFSAQAAVHVQLLDTSANTRYAGQAVFLSNTTVNPQYISTGGALVGVSSAAPVTLATNDAIYFYGTYEAA